MKENKKLKITFIISNREYESKLIKFLKRNGFDKYFLLYGKGSANSTFLEYLGVGEQEKVIMIYPTNELDATNLMNLLSNSEHFKNLIIFRSYVKGISSKKGLDYFLKEAMSNE